MIVGIDGRTLTGQYTGDRTYWRNLIRALSRLPQTGEPVRYIVYTRLPMPADALSPSSCVTVRAIPASSDRIWSQVAFPMALRRDRVDVGHTQYTTPAVAPCPMITTIHDVSFKLHPEWFAPMDRAILNFTVPRSMRRAAAVITVSQSSRNDILRSYSNPPCGVTAIPLAAGPEYLPLNIDAARALVQQKYNIGGQYLLAVSVLQPRKNLPFLLTAYANAVNSHGLSAPLLVTGKPGLHSEQLYALAGNLGVSRSVVFTGYVPDEDLPALYSGCAVMLHPALYEGFGLTPLEAMACGAPTVVSDASALPEIVGDGAEVLSVNNVAVWAKEMAAICSDRSRQAALRARGIARAAQFNWADTAEATLSVYRSVDNRFARRRSRAGLRLWRWYRRDRRVGS